MAKTTFSVKVSAPFSKKIRQFCERHSLQVGQFTEMALGETMEDFYFGSKAHIVLAEHDGQAFSHDELSKKIRRA